MTEKDTKRLHRETPNTQNIMDAIRTGDPKIINQAIYDATDGIKGRDGLDGRRLAEEVDDRFYGILDDQELLEWLLNNGSDQ